MDLIFMLKTLQFVLKYLLSCSNVYSSNVSKLLFVVEMPAFSFCVHVTQS